MNSISKIVLTATTLVFGIIFLRSGRTAIVLFLAMLFLAALIFGSISLFKWWKQRQAHQRYQASPEGKAEHRLQNCKKEIEKIEKEIAQIKEDIQDLEKGLSKADLDQHREKSQELIRGFKKEIEIRAAKIKFLKSAIKRMDQLLQRYRLRLSIESKEDKLKQLQENHFEDLAHLESLKSDVELDIFLLDDIEELQLKTLQSNSIQNIETLQKELEAMTKELDGK